MRNQRGSSLLTAMLVVAVLAILAAAILAATGQELSSAKQYKKREMLSSCATAARNWIMAQFQTGAGNEQEILEFAGSVDMGELTLRTGHIDDPAPTAAIEVVEGGGLSFQAMDLTNTTAIAEGTGRLGGKTYRAVVTCIENDTGAATEVEFQVRLAL
jgi:type II secretory pathway pseudopilin PulG